MSETSARDAVFDGRGDHSVSLDRSFDIVIGTGGGDAPANSHRLAGGNHGVCGGNT